MMDWSGNQWWPLMCLMMVALWGGIIWAVVAFTRQGSKAGETEPRSGQQILEQRLARGEISVAEFEQRRAALDPDTASAKVGEPNA